MMHEVFIRAPHLGLNENKAQLKLQKIHNFIANGISDSFDCYPF